MEQLNHDRRGSGEPLILLHGIGSHLQAFAPVMDALAAHHDVIAVDLPGFGASPALPGTTDIGRLTDAVQAFAADLGLTRWHVVGNSTGGGIALELAHRGAVASATAVSPIGFWSRRERRYAQITLGQSHMLAGALRSAGAVPALVGRRVGRTAFFGQVFARPWRLSPAECVEAIDAFVDCAAWEDTMAAFTGYVAPFDHGDVPVTIAWGDHDWLLLPRQARRARNVMGRARHVTLVGCGHVPFSDDPDLVTRVLLAGARP